MNKIKGEPTTAPKRSPAHLGLHWSPKMRDRAKARKTIGSKHLGPEQEPEYLSGFKRSAVKARQGHRLDELIIHWNRPAQGLPYK